MKLGSGGIDPDHVRIAANHVSIYDLTEPLEISCHWLFYFVILETLVIFFYNPTKMKLVWVGIDPDHLYRCTDRYFAETIPLSHWRYRFTDDFIM